MRIHQRKFAVVLRGSIITAAFLLLFFKFIEVAFNSAAEKGEQEIDGKKERKKEIEQGVRGKRQAGVNKAGRR